MPGTATTNSPRRTVWEPEVSSAHGVGTAEHARAGARATSRPNATSTSGSTASTCRPGSKTRPSACWSSSAPCLRMRRKGA